MELDRYDQHILELLQEDGRISNQDLADRIGLSPSPCLRRVRTPKMVIKYMQFMKLLLTTMLILLLNYSKIEMVV